MNMNNVEFVEVEATIGNMKNNIKRVMSKRFPDCECEVVGYSVPKIGITSYALLKVTRQTRSV